MRTKSFYLIFTIALQAFNATQAGDFRKIPYLENTPSQLGKYAGLWTDVGMNTESEFHLGASQWLYWNETGLHYTIRLPRVVLGQGNKGGLGVHLYIDTRQEYEDVLYEYREGAGRVEFAIENQPDSPRATLKKSSGLKVSDRLTCSASRAGDFIVLQGMIPWTCFPRFQHGPNKTVAFSIRLELGKGMQTGCPDLDHDVSPANNPELLEPYRLAGAGEKKTLSHNRFIAEECIENGMVFLYLQWCEPNVLPTLTRGTNTGADGRRLHIKIPELSMDKTVLLAPSAADRFLWWIERIPLNPETAPDFVTIAFERNGMTETKKMSLRVAPMIQDADARLKRIATRLNKKEPDDFIELFREAARDEIRRLQVLPDGIRPVRRRHREAANPEDVDVALDELLALAAREGREGNVKTHCWIRADGVRSPFKVYYPDSHDPDRKYPVVYQHKGYNRYSTRSHFMLLRSMKFFVPDKRDFFIISPYGAGNNDEQGGCEELSHLIKWTKQNLNIDPDKMTIRGHSRGGTVAFYLGARMPGIFTSIDALSADPMFRVPAAETRQMASSIYAPNIGQTETRLTAGGKDSESLLRSNRRMSGLLRNLGADVTLKVIPDVGHQLGDMKAEPSMGTPIRWEDGNPKRFRTTQPTFHDAYGIKIFEYVDAHALSGFDIVRQGATWNIKTINIRSLEFDVQWRDKTIVLDSQKITMGKSAGIFQKNKQGKWDTVEMDRIVHKSSMRPGGMADILRRNFIIVYGSQNPRFTPFLIERAHDIVRQTSGTKAQQWSGRIITIMSDEEFLATDPAQRDILLLGSAQQNKAFVRLAPQNLCGLGKILSKIDENPERNILFQAILPNEKSRQLYYFIEAGSSPLAYTGTFIKEPACDYLVSENDGGWTSQINGHFKTDWTLDTMPHF